MSLHRPRISSRWLKEMFPAFDVDSDFRRTDSKVAVSRNNRVYLSNPLLWPKLPQIWGYGIAVFSVAIALFLTQLPALHLVAAPLSLFVFAVMLTAWVGGLAPGLLATCLSILAFSEAGARRSLPSYRRIRSK